MEDAKLHGEDRDLAFQALFEGFADRPAVFVVHALEPFFEGALALFRGIAEEALAAPGEEEHARGDVPEPHPVVGQQ